MCQKAILLFLASLFFVPNGFIRLDGLMILKLICCILENGNYKRKAVHFENVKKDQ